MSASDSAAAAARPPWWQARIYGVRPSRTFKEVPSTAGGSGISRFPSMVVPGVHGVCDRAGPVASRDCDAPVWPCASPHSIGIPKSSFAG